MFSSLSGCLKATKQRFIDSYYVDPNKYKRKSVFYFIFRDWSLRWLSHHYRLFHFAPKTLRSLAAIYH